MIRFESVTKTYDNGHKALDGISLTVNKGELLAIIGPSGCGKTTTMKMVNRLVEPTGGRIFIGDKDIGTLDPVELRRNIGYVIQSIGLLPHMTIADNVALVPKLKRWDKDRYLGRVAELLRMVHLDPDVYGSRYPNQLSGGQQQRIGVIRALAADPDIILMDEPFSALDPISREQLQDELVQLQETVRKTIVFVTHDIDEAIKIADRICIMKEGRIVQIASPEQILRHPANEFVRGFIGEDRLQRPEALPAIRDVMVRPITARPNKGLAEAIAQMRKQRVDTLLVVNNDNVLLGKVSVWDIHSHYQDESLHLQDMLRSDVARVNVSQPLAEAVQIISREGIAYLPVVGDAGELLGVITRASLVDVMAEREGGAAL
ncbi:ABC transporter ATP-binding protein [Anaeroselena agilis]|uniref:Quaternary amine transport ATP-binding protein n=1 Tax=Anaeroselena agilis TaxID=3063788 RepID=A0ABU3P4Y6_9FIRM|nr:betaine/proline/choline family ABC transporter ATP-binding protein [Selenomonadales bacterium 4137-cl]